MIKIDDYDFRYIRRNSRLRRNAVLVNEDKGFNETYNLIKYISQFWGGYETIIIPYTNEKGIDGLFFKQVK